MISKTRHSLHAELNKKISIMSTQELLTFLFNAKPCVRACAIALGFITIAAMDFGTRLITLYKQISVVSNHHLLKQEVPTPQSIS